MYLYVFIFLLMAIIGFYTQLFVLRVGQMHANQRTVAEVMQIWHGEAYRTAKPLAIAGTLFPVASPTTCAISGDGVPNVLPTTSQNCNATLAVLPAGITNNMRFDSIAYTVGGRNYIVTYVQNSASGYAKAGFTLNEVSAQMKKAKVDDTTFGTTSMTACGTETHGLFTTVMNGGTAICYPTSSGATVFIPAGVVGMVSQL